MRVFVNESALTGKDLANATQLIFVLASTVLSDKDCQRIHGGLFADVRAQELKHSHLAKTE